MERRKREDTASGVGELFGLFSKENEYVVAGSVSGLSRPRRRGSVRALIIY